MPRGDKTLVSSIGLRSSKNSILTFEVLSASSSAVRRPPHGLKPPWRRRRIRLHLRLRSPPSPAVESRRRRSGARESKRKRLTTWCFSTRPPTTSCSLKPPNTSLSPPPSSPTVSG